LCNVGPAPYEAKGLDYFEGMDPENVKEFGWALAGEHTLVPELERETQKALDRLDVDPASLLSEFELSEADRAVLAQEVVQQRMQISFREAMAQGIGGWVDDDLACVRPWGFDLAEIRIPVRVRYGATDVLVPVVRADDRFDRGNGPEPSLTLRRRAAGEKIGHTGPGRPSCR
jgi:pimeloyl-ACP methyl ester carboxylesterase